MSVDELNRGVSGTVHIISPFLVPPSMSSPRSRVWFTEDLTELETSNLVVRQRMAALFNLNSRVSQVVNSNLSFISLFLIVNQEAYHAFMNIASSLY